MNTITQNRINTSLNYPQTKTGNWLSSYLQFCDRQSAMLWFAFPMIFLTCIIFTIGFALQYMVNEPAVWYYAICGVTFFANFLPHFANASTRVTVTNFLGSTILHIVLWFFIIF